MPDSVQSQSQSASATPDFVTLVRFLMEPFLESPRSLKIDCETSTSRARVWVRVAIDGEEKGRVFGRGGRNIQAIRTVLQAVAKLSGYSAYLDIYGNDHSENRERPRGERPVEKPRSRPQPRS